MLRSGGTKTSRQHGWGSRCLVAWCIDIWSSNSMLWS
jgi:hypothetical protein